MCKGYKVSVLVLCSYFACFSRCENVANVAPDPCPNGQIGCKITDKTGDNTNATNSPTNALSSSPLSIDDSKTHQQNVTDGRARAMNFTSAFQDDMKSNGLETGLPLPALHKIGLPSSSSSTAAKTSKNPSDFRIDNVSMDDDDDAVIDGDEFNVANNYSSSIWQGGDMAGKLFNAFHGGGGGDAMAEKEAVKKNGTATMAAASAAVGGGCTDRGDKFYKLGEKFSRGCDESCQCLKDGIICSQMCKMPLQVKGRNKNAQCTEEPVEGNSCCVRLTCAIANVPDLETEPIEDCVYKNTSYKRGATIKDGCEAVCICEAGGRVNCKSRCPPVQNATENCVTLPDQRDPCCKVVLCDVEEHDVNKIAMTGVDESGIISSTIDNHIVTAKALNDTSVAFTFSEKSKDCNVESSTNGVDWETIVCRDNVVTGLQPGKKYQFRLKNVASNKVEVALPASPSSSSAANQTVSSDSCTYKGKIRKIGEEFHDGCTAFCVCEKTGIDCAPIECPTDFGLDVLDPQCVDWETFPPDFVPTPPHCCPEKVHCRNNGSCLYDGKMFPNWSELPSTVTGCEKTCYCEMGNVSCQSTCPQVSSTPPAGLHCPPEQAVLTPPTEDNCCPMWVCPTVGRNEEIKMKVLEPVDENTIKLVFSVPTFLVGLNGRIELRYTSDQQNNEPSTWEQQILAPPNDLIATKELEFELGGLHPNTTYKIKISVMMHDFENAPSSSILTIRTPPSATPVTTLPPIIPVEPELRAIEVNSTFVKIAWRMFTDTELQFIDGVQLRYKEIDDKIYSATPLIHRAVTTYTIEELKPDTVYEVGIFFIPFPGQMTELQFHRTIQIRTSIENDPYKFEVMMDVHHVKSTSIEISWSGVPYPEDKFVHIFRAIYQSEGSREDVSSFKAAKRDSPQSILIQDLKPGTRYRLWLEVYLTNGRTKKSNVKDFVTKLGPSSSPSASQGKLEGMALMESSSYYGPLVAVSIFATIATMSTIILLLILAKKHGTNKAPITSPINRKNNSSAAYDNPSYKTYENDRNGCNPKNGSIALSVFPKTHVEKET